MRIEKDTIILDEKDDNFLSKFMEGTQGKITVKSPFAPGGRLEVKEVKDSKGKVLKARKEK